MSSAPPRPPKPGQVKVVRALYKYVAQYPDELSFEEGELLYISDPVSSSNTEEKMWLKAKCGNRTGLVPYNYVEDNEVLETPLHDAAKRGNLNFLEECLLSGVSCNTLDRSGSTALYWASHGGHCASMALLLQSKNIDVNVQNKLGDTALHAAAWKSRPEAVDLLLTNGADINLTNCEGKTALALASDAQVIDLLKKHTKDFCIDDGDYFVDENDSD